jgi:hypothetical protein
MADALISDEEIAVLCDLVEGRGANFSAERRNLISLLREDLSY